MARKSGADMAKEKAAKQKKMAIGLSVVLVLAMGYAVKTMMGLQSGGSQPVAADTTSVTTPTTTPAVTPTDSTSLAAPTLATGTPDASAGAPTTGADDLVSAVTPTLDVGQMRTFDKFAGKDPFANGSSSATKTTASTSSKPKTNPKTPGKTPAPPTPPAATPTSAVLSVNGTQETVNVGGTFPATNPMFQLLSLTKTTAKVTVVGGSYASGAASVTLTVGTPVTLVNTATGTKYTLILYPQGTAAATPSTTPSTTTPVTTTPVTTTTTPGN
ncbi:MAG: hypothetical protein ABUS54_04845 [Actinomycetota bacterium]